jgi:hypothetical protein
MPMPMQCNLCDGFFTESKVVGVCDQCLSEVDETNCTHPTTYLGCCVYCGKDKEE